MQFVYVNSISDRDILLERGLTGLKIAAPEQKESLWAFAVGDLNDEELLHALDGVSIYTITNILMF